MWQGHINCTRKSYFSIAEIEIIHGKNLNFVFLLLFSYVGHFYSRITKNKIIKKLAVLMKLFN